MPPPSRGLIVATPQIRRIRGLENHSGCQPFVTMVNLPLCWQGLPASGGQNQTNRTIQYHFITVTICFFIFSQFYCMLRNKNAADQKLESVHEFYRLRSCRMHVLSKNSPINKKNFPSVHRNEFGQLTELSTFCTLQLPTNPMVLIKIKTTIK
jgi:hypothetical protein